MIHTIDAIIAKVCILAFIAYTIAFKLQYDDIAIVYGILLLGIVISAGLSSYFSNKRWCSPAHIHSHTLLHYFCFIATFFAFSHL